MKFINFFYKTLLTIAIENENIDIVRLLLACPNIDINKNLILTFFIFL